MILIDRKLILTTMRTYFCLLSMLLVSALSFGQAADISNEEKPLYEQYAIERVQKLGKVLAKVSYKKGDLETRQWATEIIDTMFYEEKSRIFHQFPEHTTTQVYSAEKLIERFSQLDVVVVHWIQIFRDSLVLNQPRCQDPECRVKVYTNRTMGFKEYFLAGNGTSSLFERVFLKTIAYRIYNIDETTWYIKFDRITSLIGEPPNPNDDYDGDGILNKDDECPTTKGEPKNNGCPSSDIDGDGVMDRKDNCPDVPGDPKCQGCPCPPVPPQPMVKPGLKPFIPVYGDYKLRPKKSGAHWLWAAGLGASLGASGYSFFKCNEQFPGCRLPAAYFDADFERYREAKLHRQNAIIFGVLAGAIYATDVVDTYLAVGRMNKKNREVGRYQLGLKIEPLGVQSASLSMGIRFNLSVSSRYSIPPN